jgi:hypothetical protein
VTLGGPLETLDPAAMAADLRHSIPDYQPPVLLYDWTGFHIGALVSATPFNVSGTAVNGATGMPVTPGIVSPSDWHGGVQLGYDYMTPSRVVIGMSADVSSGSRKTVTTADASGTAAYQTNVFDTETVSRALATPSTTSCFKEPAGSRGRTTNTSARSSRGRSTLQLQGPRRPSISTSAGGPRAAE